MRTTYVIKHELSGGYVIGRYMKAECPLDARTFYTEGLAENFMVDLGLEFDEFTIMKLTVSWTEESWS
jgi:hypothetical protein